MTSLTGLKNVINGIRKVNCKAQTSKLNVKSIIKKKG